MHALEGADKQYKGDLGNGLVLRWSTERDAEEIIYLTSTVFRWGVAAPANTHLANMMQEIMYGKFPGTGVGDVEVVEDTRRHEHPLVSSTCLWRQSWSYEGLPFMIGRPEIVATDAEYRNRGLVRALFMLIHARSEARHWLLSKGCRMLGMCVFPTCLHFCVMSRLSLSNVWQARHWLAIVGVLKLNFYRGGLYLAIEQGKITSIEDWQSPDWDSPENAGFPPLVFLQVLFGHRSLNELRFAFPDVWANDEVVPLLNAFFPASPSWVLPLG